MKKYKEYKDSGIEWLGEIPSHWELSKFKHVIKDSNSGEVIDKSFWNEGCELLFTCSKAPIKSFYSEFPSRKRTVLGDILLTRNGTPYIFIPPVNSIYSNVVQRIVVNEDIDIKFIKYMLESSSTTLLGNGDIIASFNMDLWSSLNVLIPPLKEQQQIASYLDYKTSKIDELISKKEELVENLKNARQKLISETVTKGLNKDVKMKDSGVEWVGEIPEHWETSKIKYISSIFGRIGFRGYTTEDLVDDDNGAITLSPSNIDNQKLILDKKTYLSWSKYEESPEIKVFNTDIIFVKTASVGKVAYIENLTECATLNPQLIVFKDVKLNNKFLYYVLSSDLIQESIKKSSSGSVLATLTQTEIGSYKLIIPFINEQQQIVSYLDKKTSKIDELISKTEEQIEILKKAKQSLLTEVVTGKIDVRGWTE